MKHYHTAKQHFPHLYAALQLQTYRTHRAETVCYFLGLQYFEDLGLSDRLDVSPPNNNSCVNKFGEPGKCVGLRNCQVLIDRAKKIQAMFTIENLNPYICAYTRRGISVCCPDEFPTSGSTIVW